MDSGLRFGVLAEVKQERKTANKIMMKELSREKICKKEAVTAGKPVLEGAIEAEKFGG